MQARSWLMIIVIHDNPWLYRGYQISWWIHWHWYSKLVHNGGYIVGNAQWLLKDPSYNWWCPNDSSALLDCRDRIGFRPWSTIRLLWWWLGVANLSTIIAIHCHTLPPFTSHSLCFCLAINNHLAVDKLYQIMSIYWAFSDIKHHFSCTFTCSLWFEGTQFVYGQKMVG